MCPLYFFSNILEVAFEKLIFEKLLHEGRWLGLPFCLLVHKKSPFCSSRHFNLLLRKVPPWEEHGWGYHVVSYLGKSFSARRIQFEKIAQRFVYSFILSMEEKEN
jgi:hypothetical protein